MLNGYPTYINDFDWLNSASKTRMESSHPGKMSSKQDGKRRKGILKRALILICVVFVIAVGAILIRKLAFSSSQKTTISSSSNASVDFGKPGADVASEPNTSKPSQSASSSSVGGNSDKPSSASSTDVDSEPSTPGSSGVKGDQNESYVTGSLKGIPVSSASSAERTPSSTGNNHDKPGPPLRTNEANTSGSPDKPYPSGVSKDKNKIDPLPSAEPKASETDQTASSGVSNMQNKSSISESVVVGDEKDKTSQPASTVDKAATSNDGSSSKTDTTPSAPLFTQDECNAADAAFNALFKTLLQTPSYEAEKDASKAYEVAKEKCASFTSTRIGIHNEPTSFQEFYSNNFSAWYIKFLAHYVQILAYLNTDFLKKYNYDTPMGSLASCKEVLVYLLGSFVEGYWEELLSTPFDEKLKKTVIRMTANWQVLAPDTFISEFEGTIFTKLSSEIKKCFVQTEEALFKDHFSNVFAAVQIASPFLNKSAQEIVKCLLKKLIDEEYHHTLLRQLKREKPSEKATAAEGETSTWESMLPKSRPSIYGQSILIDGVPYQREVPLSPEELTAKFSEFKILAGRIEPEYMPDGLLTRLQLETVRSNPKTYVVYFQLLMDHMFDQNNKACIIQAQDLHAVLKVLVKEVHDYPLSGNYALSRLRKLNQTNSELNDSDISKLRIYLFALDGLALLSNYLKEWSTKTALTGAFYLDFIRADPAILKAYSDHFKSPAMPKPSDPALDKYLAKI